MNHVRWWEWGVDVMHRGTWISDIIIILAKDPPLGMERKNVTIGSSRQPDGPESKGSTKNMRSKSQTTQDRAATISR